MYDSDINIKELSKRDLELLHALILTLIRNRKINYLSLGKVIDGKMSLLYSNNLWYLFDIHDNDYILTNLEFACIIIIRGLSNNKEEDDLLINYFKKIANTYTSSLELQDYLLYYKDREENKYGRRLYK